MLWGRKDRRDPLRLQSAYSSPKPSSAPQRTVTLGNGWPTPRPGITIARHLPRGASGRVTEMTLKSPLNCGHHPRLHPSLRMRYSCLAPGFDSAGSPPPQEPAARVALTCPACAASLSWASPFQAASSNRPSQWLKQWSSLALSKDPCVRLKRGIDGPWGELPSGARAGLTWTSHATSPNPAISCSWGRPPPSACPQAQSNYTSSPFLGSRPGLGVAASPRLFLGAHSQGQVVSS